MAQRILSEVCFINMGQSPESSSHNSDAIGMPFYQGNADFGKRHPKTRIWCSKPIKIAQKNDILISVRAPIGAMNIANENCCIGRGLAAIRSLDTSVCNMNYLYYFIKSKIKYLESKGTGSTFKAINKGILHDLIINLPQINEQQKISEMLINLEEEIDYKELEINQIDNLVKSQFIEMFGDLNQWEKKMLPEIAEMKIGLTYKPADVTEKNGIIVLRSSNIQNGELCFDDIVRVDKKVKDSLMVKNGDILMCSRNGSARLVGKSTMIKDLPEPMTFGAFMTIIQSPYAIYLQNFFATPYYKSQLTCTGTTTVNQITINMLNKIVVPLPPIDLQNKFAEIVKLTDKLKFVNEINAQMTKLCYSIMSGQYCRNEGE